jgi:hypothetical protein
MTASSLPAALRAGADGVYVLDAAAQLIIAHGTWLTRNDFTQFIHTGTGTAAIDWEACNTSEIRLQCLTWLVTRRAGTR